MGEPENVCGNCKFFEARQADKHPDDREGHCHRRAPVTTSHTITQIAMLLLDLHYEKFDGETGLSRGMDFESEALTSWPWVEGYEWCGEFEPA